MVRPALRSGAREVADSGPIAPLVARLEGEVIGRAGRQTCDQTTLRGSGRLRCGNNDASGQAEVRSVNGRPRATEVVLGGRSRGAVVTRRGPGYRLRQG